MDTFLLVTHLCGVALLFIMISIELVVLSTAPRSRTTAQLRAATFASPAAERIAPAATVLIVVTGLWMVADRTYLDFSEAWVIVSIIATVVLSVVGPTVQGRRLGALRSAAYAAPEGSASPQLVALARDGVMQTAGWASSGAAFGFLYVMVAKPEAFWTIGAFVIAPIIGILIGRAALNGAPRSVPEAV